MILKFIGKDGSMGGLRRGKEYNVSVVSVGNFIGVRFASDYDKPKLCLYSSPQKLALHWEKET